MGQTHSSSSSSNMKAAVIFISLLVVCSSRVIKKRSLLGGRQSHGHGHHELLQQATSQQQMTMSMKKKILQVTMLTRLVVGVMILLAMRIICLGMKMVLKLKRGAKLSMMMNKVNMKMININMKKHLEKMSFLKVLDLPVILITAMLHLMLVELLMMVMVLLKRKLLPEMFLVTILYPLRPKIKVVAMEHQLELELKVNIQLQELLMKSTVLLVSMRGARVVFHLLLWKEDKDQKLQQLMMEMMVMKTPKCVLEGPWISVCLCARVSLPGCTGPVCRAVRTGAGSEEHQQRLSTVT